MSYRSSNVLAFISILDATIVLSWVVLVKQLTDFAVH
jgi:hypothetical protein